MYKVLVPRSSAIRHFELGDGGCNHDSQTQTSIGSPRQRLSCEFEHIISTMHGRSFQRRTVASRGWEARKESFWQVRYRTLSFGSLICLKQAGKTVASECMCRPQSNLATQHDMATPLSCGESTKHLGRGGRRSVGKTLYSSESARPLHLEDLLLPAWRAHCAPPIGWILGLGTRLHYSARRWTLIGCAKAKASTSPHTTPAHFLLLMCFIAV